MAVEMVVEAVGGRSRSEEKSKSGTFPPRLEIPQKRRGFQLLHPPPGSRKSGGISTSSTAPAATVKFETRTRRDCDPHASPLDSYKEANSSLGDCSVGGLIQTAVGWGGCFGQADRNDTEL